VLIAPAIVTLSIGADANTGIRLAIAAAALLVVVAAVAVSKRRSISIADDASVQQAITMRESGAAPELTSAQIAEGPTPDADDVVPPSYQR
jgi:K(+)-stimulated pyrophosphate-energized sodium pump